MTAGRRESAVPSVGMAPIVLERTYRAAVEELWALWTTKDGFESWWGPEGYRIEVHLIEARLGGVLDYDMIADSVEVTAAQQCEPGPLNSRARFAEFVPHRRLALVQPMDDVATGAPSYDHRIEVDFRALGDIASMVVSVHPHLDPDRTRISIRAFNEQLAKLDRRFGRARAI